MSRRLIGMLALQVMILTIISSITTILSIIVFGFATLTISSGLFTLVGAVLSHLFYQKYLRQAQEDMEQLQQEHREKQEEVVSELNKETYPQHPLFMESQDDS